MAKSGKEWLGVAICDFMWLNVAKNGFMRLKVVLCGSKYVLPKR